MNKIKSHLGNFDRCRKLVSLFQQHGTQIPIREIHSFIGWADRNTLRLEVNFSPLQRMVKKLSERLVNDAFMSNKPLMIARMSSIYLFLNYYDSKWMDYSAAKLSKWLEEKRVLRIEQILPLYRLFVELGWQENYQVLRNIRFKVKDILLQDIKDCQDSNFSRTIERIHKDIRTLLLDEKIQPNEINQLIQKMSKLFDQRQSKLDDDYHYVHSAMLYLFLEVLNIPVNRGSYKNFLQQAYSRYRSTLGSREHHENINPQFSRRGQSVFEIRFQKHLQEQGYWFERNKIIGLHQFDILLKGRLQKDFHPFERLICQKDINNVVCISEEELKLFRKMDNLWKINRKQLWSQPILINLNGPYHQIYGDKPGTVRTQTFKKVIVAHYGFKQFRSVNFRDWEKRTPNKKSAALYLKKLIDQQ